MTFTAVGDEAGLLLVIKRGRVLGFDEGRPAGIFAAKVALCGAGSGRLVPSASPFEIVGL